MRLTPLGLALKIAPGDFVVRTNKARTTAWMQEVEQRREQLPSRAAVDFCSCKIYISAIHGGHRVKSAFLDVPFNPGLS